MRHTFFAVRALAAVLAVALADSPALAQPRAYSATLSGGAEAAPVETPGYGYAFIFIDPDLFTMRVQASFADLLGVTTVAHIHCCTAIPGEGTAGVATTTPTFTGFPAGVTSGEYDLTFDLTLASSWNPAFLTANSGDVSQAYTTFINGLDAGSAYFNIHTDRFPPGEIRGFLQRTEVPEPASILLLTTGLLALAGVAKRQLSRR